MYVDQAIGSHMCGEVPERMKIAGFFVSYNVCFGCETYVNFFVN